MRPQQNRRMRGRSNNNNNNSNNNNNNRRGPNPLTRNYESSGPDVKIRGNAQHIADKYLTLSRDAQSSGDRVMAENYLQHAEHYMRIILSAQGHIQQNANRDDQSDDSVENTVVDANDMQEVAGSGPQPSFDNLPIDGSSDTENGEHSNKARDRSYGGRKPNGLRRNPRQPRSNYNERNFERVTSSQNDMEIVPIAPLQQEATETVAPSVEAVDAPKKRSAPRHTDTKANATETVKAEVLDAKPAEAVEAPAKKTASKTRTVKPRAAKVIEASTEESAVEEKPRRKRRITKAEAEETEA